MDIIDTILNLEVRGSKYGLERTRTLLRDFGYPEKKLKIVHIAGSNGKGSIAEYITRILLAEGKSVGTFTSPAVFDYAEKFKVNGNLPDMNALRDCLSRVYSKSLSYEDRATSFELETVAALLLFAEAGLEYAVVECGLGGRDDATNAVSCKQIAVISSVSLEHTAILGNTITEICAHKAGIIKDCPAVVNSLQSEEGRAYFASLGVRFADGVEDIREEAEGQSFVFGGKRYFIRMNGRAQCYNAATAALACSMLGISRVATERGLYDARLDGRVQKILRGGRTYILDGAHNPAAFEPLIGCVHGMKGKKTLVFSCLSDKDVTSAAALLSPLFDRIILVPAPSYRQMDGQKMFAAFSGRADDIVRADSVSSALGMAEDETVVLCGSFTVLKEGRQWIEREQ